LCQVYIKRYPKFISKDIALSPKWLGLIHHFGEMTKHGGS
jgi:hypothetical protein